MSIVVKKIVPVRSKNAVNKSLRDNRKSAVEKPSKPDDKIDDSKLEEIFQRNLDMIIALLPSVPIRNLPAIRKWISKFFDPSIPKTKRNFYSSFLIFQMQNLRITDPFNKNPPQALVDPNKISSHAKWKTLLQDADKDHFERMRERISIQQMGNFRKNFKGPGDFYQDQPVPENGIVCYGGCFSNHFL